MPADANGTSENGNRNGSPVAMLPVLNPVLVARGDEVDQVIGPARAGIAALSLQLRVALRDAAAAEGAAAQEDLDAASQMLTTGLDEMIAERGRQLAAELEAERLEAAGLLLNAQEQAAALVAQAGAEIVQAILQGSDLIPVPCTKDPGAATVPRPEPGPTPEPSPAPAPVSSLTPGPGPAPATAPDDATASVPTVPPGVRPHAGRALLRRYLYMDVVLPVIAVLIVFAVLLAWVG